MTDTASQKRIAHILGVTTREIYNLRQKGLPTEAEGGRVAYPVGECVQWYVRYRESLSQRGEPTDIEEARARKLAAEAELAELQLARARAEVVELTAVEEEARAHNERLAARVKGLGRYMGDVQRAMSDIEAAEVLRRIEDDLLAALYGASDDDSDLIEIAA